MTVRLANPPRKRILCELRIFLATSILALFSAVAAQAEPSTVTLPRISITGDSEGGRFGSAVNCSQPILLNQSIQSSVVAVGAPGDGNGKVYIVDPTASSNNILQTLAPVPEDNAKEFGYALTFFSDVNGDGKDEIAVSSKAQGDTTGSQRSVILFLSSGNGTDKSWVRCGKISATTSGEFGFSLARAGLSGFTDVEIFVGNRLAGTVDGYHLSPGGGGSCTAFRTAGFFDIPGYGAALSTTFDSAIDPDVEEDLLIGSVGSNLVSYQFSGGSSVEVSDPNLGSDKGFGSSLAAGTAADQVAVGAPGAGYVGIFRNLNTAPGRSNPACYLQPTGQEISGRMGSAMSVVPSLSPNPSPDSSVYVTSDGRSLETGGTLTLFWSVPAYTTCEEVPLNNCLLSESQEQGLALDGRVCKMNGEVFIAAGSPGAGSTGRLDLYFQDDINNGLSSGVAIPCSEQPTPTPTPTPTATSTPGSTPGPDGGGVEPGQGSNSLPPPQLKVIAPGKLEIRLDKELFLAKISPERRKAILKLAKKFKIRGSALKLLSRFLKKVTATPIIEISDVAESNVARSNSRAHPVQKIRASRNGITTVNLPGRGTVSVRYRVTFPVPKTFPTKFRKALMKILKPTDLSPPTNANLSG